MDTTPAEIKMHLPLFIDQSKAGTYFTLPFNMPEDVETFSLTYSYERHRESERQVENGTFVSRQEVNVIDLGLIDPHGRQVGVSGSNKMSITVSETQATPGYHPCALIPGQWQIIVGAYKVAPGGVNVLYELSFSLKTLRLYKGDLHTHTIASDGALTLDELARLARSNGLDFLAVTDHNQMVSADTLLEHAHLTLIPGMEWTHFRGHANFLGMAKPPDEPFFANTIEEMRQHFESARAHGALIVINHPRDSLNPFELDLEQLPFDCLEIWKGLIIESNLLAIAWWQKMLEAGKKIPVCGGSDYHEGSLNRFPGGPTTCAYAMSGSVSDILSALKQGHAFITFAPYGPTLEVRAGEVIMGDSVSFSEVNRLEYVARGLSTGDVLRVITGHTTIPLLEAQSGGEVRGTYTMDAPGFARFDILRRFLPNLPLMPVLVSNPIYFDA